MCFARPTPRAREQERSCVLGNLTKQAFELAGSSAETLAHGPVLGGERGHLCAQTGIFLTQLFHGPGECNSLVGECLKIIDHGRDVNKHSPRRIIAG